jgi:hypothetical protein
MKKRKPKTISSPKNKLIQLLEIFFQKKKIINSWTTIFTRQPSKIFDYVCLYRYMIILCHLSLLLELDMPSFLMTPSRILLSWMKRLSSNIETSRNYRWESLLVSPLALISSVFIAWMISWSWATLKPSRHIYLVF